MPRLYATISHQLWADVLKALESGDEQERQAAHRRLRRVAPGDWDPDVPVHPQREVPPAGAGF